MLAEMSCRPSRQDGRCERRRGDPEVNAWYGQAPALRAVTLMVRATRDYGPDRPVGLRQDDLAALDQSAQRYWCPAIA